MIDLMACQMCEQGGGQIASGVEPVCATPNKLRGIYQICCGSCGVSSKEVRFSIYDADACFRAEDDACALWNRMQSLIARAQISEQLSLDRKANRARL